MRGPVGEGALPGARSPEPSGEGVWATGPPRAKVSPLLPLSLSLFSPPLALSRGQQPSPGRSQSRVKQAHAHPVPAAGPGDPRDPARNTGVVVALAVSAPRPRQLRARRPSRLVRLFCPRCVSRWGLFETRLFHMMPHRFDLRAVVGDLFHCRLRRLSCRGATAALPLDSGSV